VAADVDHLHVKRIHLEPLVGHLYIAREDVTLAHVLGWLTCQPELIFFK
jgi:hypothetical protein